MNQRSYININLLPIYPFHTSFVKPIFPIKWLFKIIYIYIFFTGDSDHETFFHNCIFTFIFAFFIAEPINAFSYIFFSIM